MFPLSDPEWMYIHMHWR